MAVSAKITIADINRVADGDVLITFSDDTIVLFHAKYLYEHRNQDHNLEVVDPFKE